MDKRVDLHVHTKASDGTFTPAQVVGLAKEAHLAAIAITDHDTTGGVAEAMEAGEACGLEVVPGIELSTEYKGVEIHVVGLYIDIENEALQKQARIFREKRDGRNIEMVKRLQAEGFAIELAEVTRRNPNSVIARPHIAKYLVETGQAPDTKWVFNHYIAEGKSCYVGREMITPMDAVHLIKAAGGTAILAHPCLYKKLTQEELYQMIADCVAAGLDGIETRYSLNKEGDEERFTAQAEKYGLLPSGGSDFHGANKPNIALGTGTGDLYIPYAFLQAIRDARRSS